MNNREKKVTNERPGTGYFLPLIVSFDLSALRTQASPSELPCLWKEKTVNKDQHPALVPRPLLVPVNCSASVISPQHHGCPGGASYHYLIPHKIKQESGILKSCPKCLHHLPLAVVRHHNQGRKCLFWALWFQKDSGSSQSPRENVAAPRDHFSDPKQEAEDTGKCTWLLNFEAHLQWHTSSRNTTPPNPS